MKTNTIVNVVKNLFGDDHFIITHNGKTYVAIVPTGTLPKKYELVEV